MLESQWNIMFIVGHILLLAGAGMGFFRIPKPAIIFSAMIAMLLFLMTGVSASNVVTISNGTKITSSHPGMGWYSLAAAFVAFVFMMFAIIQFLPSRRITNDRPI